MTVEIDITIDQKIKQENKEPSKFKVLMLNDDHTPMDWVIDVLRTVFKHSETTAKEWTMKIHNEGSAVVAIYTYGIAAQKTVESVNASRERGFPLQLTLEEE